MAENALSLMWPSIASMNQRCNFSVCAQSVDRSVEVLPKDTQCFPTSGDPTHLYLTNPANLLRSFQWYFLHKDFQAFLSWNCIFTCTQSTTYMYSNLLDFIVYLRACLIFSLWAESTFDSSQNFVAQSRIIVNICEVNHIVHSHTDMQ